MSNRKKDAQEVETAQEKPSRGRPKTLTAEKVQMQRDWYKVVQLLAKVVPDPVVLHQLLEKIAREEATPTRLENLEELIREARRESHNIKTLIEMLDQK